jgi:hypothetical protein
MPTRVDRPIPEVVRFFVVEPLPGMSIATGPVL